MALFGRKKDRQPASGLPADIVERVMVYIEFETDPQNSRTDPEQINQLIYQPLYQYAANDPVRFSRELSAAVLPAGGLAARGGARLVRDLIAGDFDDPSYHAMLDSALEWMRASGYQSAYLNGYEMSRWFATHPGTPWQ